jgi:hypothetical protein
MMANWFEPTPEQVRVFAEWVASRPEAVRNACARFLPWELYRLRDTGHRVVIHSIGQVIDEDGEPTGDIVLTVDVLGRFNFVALERRVFGIDPDDLEPCDLPAEGEMLGSLELPIQLLAGRMKKLDDDDEEEEP